MPLLLQCDELEAGMRLSEAIVYRGRRLLTGGKVLTHADVEILARKHPDLRVRIGDPILDEVIDFEDDAHDRKVASTARKKVAAAMSEVNRRFSTRASVSALNITAIHKSVTEVMGFLHDNPVSAALLSSTLDPGTYLTDHAGNVFYLSMILGCAVRDYVSAERQRRAASPWRKLSISMDLLPLGLGAMLADVGMLPLQHLYTKREPLTDDDRKAVLEHPVKGAAMLPPDLSPIARAVVRVHHENFDGSGYPAGISADRIHVFGRIVRIADAYDAATAPHVFRDAKSPVRALWEMSAGPYRRFYDPVLMRVFSCLIQPFPIGAKLGLENGRQAVVVRYNRNDPFLPHVVIAFDADNRRLPDTALEGPFCLADRPEHRVVSCAGESVAYLYEPPPPAAPTPVRERMTSIFEAIYP